VNLYACCSGNPLKFSDLDGRAGRNPTPQEVKTLAERGITDPGTVKRLVNLKPIPRKAATGMSKQQARAAADVGAARARAAMGMTDPDVQAGHTVAARHSPESRIDPGPLKDPATIQQLHSRKGKGLDVTVTDQEGQVKVTTRHRAQEGMLDEGVGRAKQANQNVAVPEGQLETSAYVRWRTENVPLDQRNVEAVRQSGPAAPEKGAPINPETGEVLTPTPRSSPGSPAEASPGATGSRVPGYLGRIASVTGIAGVFLNIYSLIKGLYMASTSDDPGFVPGGIQGTGIGQRPFITDQRKY
jgi:hypothetical protein